MIDRAAAEAIAKNFLKSRNYNDAAGERVIVPEETIETPYGWVFFYVSEKYLETGDTSFLLVGAAPILVEKDTGSIQLLNPSLLVDESLKMYEEEKGLNS